MSEKKKKHTLQKVYQIDEYEIRGRIGGGLSGQVFLASHPLYGEVCIKIIFPAFLKSRTGQKLVENQIILHSGLGHPNVVKLLEVMEKNGVYMLVTEYCNGSDLERFAEKKLGMEERNCLKLFAGIVKGCKYLSRMKIIHRDLKPANIFLQDDVPKIADFGFAVRAEDSALMGINAGSPLYMAPQALGAKQFSHQSDIFSLGVIFSEMLGGKTPWSASSQTQLLYKMKNFAPKLPEKCSSKMKSLIGRCLNIEKAKRPTIFQLEKEIFYMISQLPENVYELPLQKKFITPLLYESKQDGKSPKQKSFITNRVQQRSKKKHRTRKSSIYQTKRNTVDCCHRIPQMSKKYCLKLKQKHLI